MLRTCRRPCRPLPSNDIGARPLSLPRVRWVTPPGRPSSSAGEEPGCAAPGPPTQGNGDPRPGLWAWAGESGVGAGRTQGRCEEAWTWVPPSPHGAGTRCGLATGVWSPLDERQVDTVLPLSPGREGSPPVWERRPSRPTQGGRSPQPPCHTAEHALAERSPADPGFLPTDSVTVGRPLGVSARLALPVRGGG